MSEHLPLTITECVRELSKLVPGAESMPFIQARMSVTWTRQADSEAEHWTEEFTVLVGPNMRVTERTLQAAYHAARDYIWQRYQR